MPSLIDLSGHKIGRLTVLHRAPGRNNGRTYWSCVCDCGKDFVADAAQFRTSRVPSCGCYNNDLSTSRLKTHGQSYTPEYRAWTGMKSRCQNPSNAAYYKYGGRGIQVCDRWMTFENFREDMGPRPSNKHTIDRIDGSKGYEPTNCRWATPREQQLNLKNNVRLTHDGKSLTMGEWASIVGLKPKTIQGRLRLGWSVEDALTKPLFYYHPNRKPRSPKS